MSDERPATGGNLLPDFTVPAVPSAFSPAKRRRWPWDQKASFVIIVILSILHILTVPLACLFGIIAAAPSEPCHPSASTCGPEPLTMLAVSAGALTSTTVAILLGWLPGVPARLRVAALLLGLTAVGVLFAIIITR